MKTTQVVSAALALALLASDGWLLLPSRNALGNPDMESLIGSCKTSEAVTASLYRGNGGATTAYWYTVTLEGDKLGREKQVFFSYREPSPKRIICNGTDIVISGDSFNENIAAANFAKMRNSPMQYWRGERREGGTQPSSVLQGLAAGVAFLVATALLLRLYRASRRRSATHAA
jgi:hypothetical protein